MVNTDVRGRSYAPAGETPVAFTVGSTRHKLSMIATVSNRGKARWMIIDEAFNSNRMGKGLTNRSWVSGPLFRLAPASTHGCQMGRRFGRHTGLVEGCEGFRFETACAATLLVCHLRQPEQRDRISVERAADWLASLAA